MITLPEVKDSLLHVVNNVSDDIVVRVFQRWHLKSMDKQVEQKDSLVAVDQLDSRPELCFTLFSNDGEILGCMGVVNGLDGDSHGLSWAINSKSFAESARPISRIVNKFFEELGEHHIYSKVYGSSRVGWRPGRTWLKMIGFTPLPEKFDIADKTYRLYERELI